MKRGITFRQKLGRTLAVLFLIVVLLAILFPVCGCKNREKVRQAVCLSNEKQLGLGLLQYAQDNDGLLPPITDDRKTWRAAAYGYIKSSNTYKCPHDTCGIAPDGFASSYALNVNSIKDTPGAKPHLLNLALYPYTLIDSTPYPETLVLLCEVQNTTDADFDIDDPLRFPPDKHILAVRHAGGSNYLLADGHAKYFRPSAFTYVPPATAKTGQAIVRWHRDPHHPLSENEMTVLADAQARAQ